jgi:hypothetical protein
LGLDESQSHNYGQTRFGQVIDCKIHCSNGRSNLAFAHCSGPQKNGKLRICVDFRKLNATMKQDPYPLPFTEKVLDMVVGHKIYSFLDGFFGYHQIMITLEDQYKTTFIAECGAFLWLVMPFGLNNVSPNYQ